MARVPPADRQWLAAMNAALLVPIFAGGSEPRPFVGLIALGLPVYYFLFRHRRVTVVEDLADDKN